MLLVTLCLARPVRFDVALAIRITIPIVRMDKMMDNI